MPITIATPDTLRIVVDGVFFQLHNTGIAVLWRSVLKEWVKSGFAKNIVLLDRNKTAPRIPGIASVDLPSYEFEQSQVDRVIVQRICGILNADLFISTYYSTPITTASAFLGYDMIPEVTGMDLMSPVWREKHRAMTQATTCLAISNNTAKDMARFVPSLNVSDISVVHCGIAQQFRPSQDAIVDAFLKKYALSRPYIFVPGNLNDYKNGKMFFQAMRQYSKRTNFSVLCTDRAALSYAGARPLDFELHTHRLTTYELKLAYAGAYATVYPSLYEGFGLPVAEAMACGSPIICSPTSSLPEVGGEAPLYVVPGDIEGLHRALDSLADSSVRREHVTAGLAQARRFSWKTMAAAMAQVLGRAARKARCRQSNQPDINVETSPTYSLG